MSNIFDVPTVRHWRVRSQTSLTLASHGAASRVTLAEDEHAITLDERYLDAQNPPLVEALHQAHRA